MKLRWFIVSLLLSVCISTVSIFAEQKEYVSYQSIEGLHDRCRVLCPDVPPPCWKNCPPCGKPVDNKIYITVWDDPWEMYIYRGDKYMCWGADVPIHFHMKARPAYDRKGKRIPPKEPNPDPTHHMIGTSYYLSTPYRNKSLVVKFNLEDLRNCPVNINGTKLQSILKTCYKDVDVESLGWAGNKIIADITLWEHHNRTAMPRWQKADVMKDLTFIYEREKKFAFRELLDHYVNIGREIQIEIPSHVPGDTKWIASFAPYTDVPQITERRSPIVNLWGD